MAKSLGQIHSVNTSANFTASNQKNNIDLPGQLSAQLNRMVRAGTFHKVVGIDIGIDPVPLGAGLGGQVNGKLRYYAPTRGRCAAFRGAFKSTAELMKTQGISMRTNELYDFKVPLNNEFANNGFDNQASLDGINGLALVNTVPGASIFGVHNAGVQPGQTSPSNADLYSEGFNTLMSSGTVDFVLNDNVPFDYNPEFASEEYEEIPFSLVYDPGAGTVSNFQWRPDPALYLAVMCGQIQIVIDEYTVLGGAASLTLKVNTMVSGWKSIMGDPDKKRRRSSKKKTKQDKFLDGVVKSMGRDLKKRGSI